MLHVRLCLNIYLEKKDNVQSEEVMRSILLSELGVLLKEMRSALSKFVTLLSPKHSNLLSFYLKSNCQGDSIPDN